MAAQRVLIADGHHRWTSLAYRDAMQAAAGGKPEALGRAPHVPGRRRPARPGRPGHPPALAGVGGPTVLAGLEGDFDVRPAASPAEASRPWPGCPATRSPSGCTRRAELAPGRPRPAGLAAEAGRDRRMLDVEVLHGPVLSKRLGVSDFEGRVAYQSDLAAAVAAVEAPRQPADPPPGPVRRRWPRSPPAARSLPQKTTFFYPKSRGLVWCCGPLTEETP